MNYIFLAQAADLDRSKNSVNLSLVYKKKHKRFRSQNWKPMVLFVPKPDLNLGMERTDGCESSVGESAQG